MDDNNRIAQAKQKYTAFIEKNEKLFLDVVANNFMVETRYKYLDWLMYTLQKKKVDIRLKDIISALDKFNQVGSKFERKNIYSYNSIEDLQNTVSNYIRKEEENDKGKEIVYKDSNYEVERIIDKNGLNKINLDHTWFETDIFKKGMLFKIQYKNEMTDFYFVRYGIGHTLEKIEFTYAGHNQILIFKLSEVVKERILLYVKKHDDTDKFLTYTQFDDLLNEEIIKSYPKTFQVREKTIEGKYINDNGFLKLQYEVPFYNALLFVKIHLFDSAAPLTIQTQSLTSSEADKNKTFRPSFPETAFKDRKFCFHYLNKEENKAPELCLKMIEFTIGMFIESPEFLSVFSPDTVFWGSRTVYQNKPYFFEIHTDYLEENRKVALKTVEYVKEKTEKNQDATRYDFTYNHLGKTNISVRDLNNELFTSLLNADVLQIKRHTEAEGYSYILGPSYQAFIEGRLKRHI